MKTNSHLIASITRKQRSTTEVVFNDGSAYRFNLTPEQHTAFVTAPSVGKHFLSTIRGRFDGEKIRESK